MKRIIVFIIFITVFITGCDKGFSELNTNNTIPAPNQVSPDLYLSGIIRNQMNRQVDNAWGIGNIVVQYHAKIQFVGEDRYSWNEQNSVWNSVLSDYRNLQNIFAQVGTANDNSYNGVALVLKSWMFATLTNAYGDVPYSEAGKAKVDGKYQPKYDSQEKIYEGILSDLKKANEVLSKSSNPLAGDILYGGGTGAIMKWRKLANSLRLRYLMRISEKKNVAAEMQEIVSNPTLYPIFTSNADNAELQYLAASPNQWPLYSTRVGSFDEFRVSKTLEDRLKAINDPRLQVFARPTVQSVKNGTPEIKGVPNGLEDVAALAYNGGVQNISRIGYTFACLVCNDQGQAPPDPTAPKSILMNFSELQFILAEAREKAMVTTGNAEGYYLKGVQANLDYWKSIVPHSYNINLEVPANYFSQAGVSYAGSQSEKLSKIYLQKWVAQYFMGLEAWFDWRRTRQPEIIPGPSNLNNNKVPVRFIYPSSEQSLNGVNRDDAVKRQGGTDDINALIWIIK